MVTVYINRWGIKIPALLYCYPSKTKGPEYLFLSLSILLFSIIDKAIMQHFDSHHLVEVNLHRCQLLLNLTLTFFKERSISLIYPHFGHLISIFPVVIVILSKTHHSPDKAAIIRINVLVTCIFSFQSSSERLPILWFGINPFTCLNWERRFAPPLSKNFSTFFENKKSRLF